MQINSIKGRRKTIRKLNFEDVIFQPSASAFFRKCYMLRKSAFVVENDSSSQFFRVVGASSNFGDQSECKSIQVLFIKKRYAGA